jgi:DHA3 family tetracycline resistance protein-like MFS transporter
MSLRENRDFRLLFAGRSVSLLGDGAFLVALAWEAYTLSNAPTALSLIGVAMTVPTVSLLLFGGVVSDRYERRTVMLLADALRAVLLLLAGSLAVAGDLGLWQLIVIVAFYGAAQAFFDPASDAILPEIVGPDELGRANALEQVARPLTLRLIGPALGGVLVGTIGSGAAFMADGISFVVSAATLWLMASSPALRVAASAGGEGSAVRQVLEGWAYVRRHVWLWGTFASAGIAYLLFMGPAEVLLPFMVKHELHGSGFELGLVFGAGGLGAVLCAVTIMRGGLPSSSVPFIYLSWTLATLAVAGYGLANAIWQLMLASLAFNLLETGGTIVWATLKQRLVPGRLLGRVSSLDWLISIGLLPVSFALTAPVSAVLGVRTTLIAAGLAGALATLGGLALPGMRSSEQAPAPRVSAGAPV